MPSLGERDGITVSHPVNHSDTSQSRASVRALACSTGQIELSSVCVTLNPDTAVLKEVRSWVLMSLGE